MRSCDNDPCPVVTLLTSEDEAQDTGQGSSSSQRVADEPNIGDAAPRTEAKPLAPLDPIAGCGTPSEADVEELLDTLDDKGP